MTRSTTLLKLALTIRLLRALEVSRAGIDADGAAVLLGVSRRTAYRYREVLVLAGVPLVTIARRWHLDGDRP